ncbi:MAG: (d)CMP kinase [candidate division Zixibacteria bacterium]|nr:(d)CMP kinase [candidate division Zixibacteria bacterium]
MIIAIDGPAGSGKSTTAKAIAHKLGLKFIDTGAMYRAITLKFIQSDVDLSDIDKLKKILGETRIDFKESEDQLSVYMDGVDVTESIRSKEVTELVSQVSVIPEVRNALVPVQRKLAEGEDVVAEGRDIGTVVFPEAELKIFMVASETERAKRRLKEMQEKRIKIDYEEVQESIKMRDTIDSTRVHSPLTKAPDAVEVDTTNLTFEEQVNLIITLYKSRAAVNFKG